MQIAVVGAGPAGAWASILLAKRGYHVTLIDSQGPWEKPCGGGVTTKVLSSFGLFGLDLPRNPIDQITIYFGNDTSVSVAPQNPLAVLSRHELARNLFQEAEKAGVSILKARVTHIDRVPYGWKLATREGTLQSDFLIGADGATSLVRRTVSTALQPQDLCVTIGYFIPGQSTTHMKRNFCPSIKG